MAKHSAQIEIEHQFTILINWRICRLGLGLTDGWTVGWDVRQSMEHFKPLKEKAF